MSEHEDTRGLREHKLHQLAALGLPYLPNRYGPTRQSCDIVRRFEALEGSGVRVAGRIMRIRLMGKAAFAHVQDRSGQIQLYFKLDTIGADRFDYFKLLDIGDTVGVEGTVFKTRTGEVSVAVEDLVLLAKAYLPLPDKFHGLADVETRYRQRYVDLIANEEARKIAHLRADVVREIRDYLHELDFVEVETPILQPLYGGAAANPFTAHYASLDMDVYLRIATELYLKRLIVGGLERVFELGKDFRNEGFSRKHSPEFTQVELYQAYADYTDIMALVEDLFITVATKVCGAARVTFDGNDIDLSPPWRRVTMRDAIHELTGIDIDVCTDVADLTAAATERGLSIPPGAPRGQVIEEIVSEKVEPRFIQPTILMDFPIDYPGSLLAKRKAGREDLAERFEFFMGGIEIGNAFTELNEPADQLARMRQLATESGGGDADVDWDYIRALEYGMPPTGGVGFGIDRMVMILSGVHNVRETILFPLLRQKDERDA